MKHVKVWSLMLLSLFVMGLVPKATCQETNMVYIRTIISIGDINFKEGKLILNGLYLTVDANKSFGVYLFAPSTYSPNYWDEASRNENGWYSLHRDYFPNGIELKFNLKEGENRFIFCNEVLDFAIAIGLNVTTYEYTQDEYADLNLPLKDEWQINSTIVKVSKEEAALYTVHGMSAINSSIRSHNIREFFVLKIQINRKPNIENALIWLPPIFMLILLLVSIFLVYKKDLANSLRVYLTVAFFSFGYLSMLREITPPIMTSIEDLTLVDAILCLLLSIIVILRIFFAEKKELRERESLKESLRGKK